MTPRPNEKPEHTDPWLELDPPDTKPQTVRVEPAAPQPAEPESDAQLPDTVARPRLMVPIRYYWRRLVLLAMGFVAVIGTFLYFQIQPDPGVKYKRGLAALEKRDWNTAIANFSDVIRTRPGDGSAHYYRGTALSQAKQYDRAIPDFGEAIRLKKWIIHAHVERAICYAHQGETDRAIADCAAALRLDATFSDAYGTRGWVYSKRGEYAQALLDLNEAIRWKPDNKGHYLDRANVYYWLQDDDRAIADFNHVLGLDPKNEFAHVGRGMVYQVRKQYALAIAEFEAAIRLNPRPEEGAGYNDLAWLLATCAEAEFRDGKRAIQLAMTACELTSWSNRGCLQTFAAAHAEAGNFAEAVKWQKKSLEFPGQFREEDGTAKVRLILYEQGKALRED